MKCRVIPVGFVIGCMVFFTSFTNYMLKSNMSVSVVEMAHPLGHKNASCGGISTPKTNTTAKPRKGAKIFNWTQQDQGILLQAYFIGNMVTFLPGGVLAEQLGATNVIFWTSVLCVILTAITPPTTVHWGWTATWFCRFLVGVFGGPGYPAMNTLISKWATPTNRSRYLSALLGNCLGVVLSWIMVGNTTYLWGWEAGFYSVAVFMGLYCVAFIICSSDTPEKHRWITDEEKNYILTEQGGTVSKKKKIPPYRRIACSIPFWATILAQFGNLWSLNLVLTFAPKYFKEVLGFNLKSSVGLASIPYLLRLSSAFFFSNLSIWLKKKKSLSLILTRKLGVVVSHLLPAICFCMIYIAGCNWQVNVTLLCLNNFFNGAVVIGHLVNCQDLAPNFAGTLYGIMNFTGNFSGIIVPYISSAIMDAYKDNPVLGASFVYLVGGFVLVGTAVIFFLFGSADVQKWNDIDTSGDAEVPKAE